MRPRYWSSFWIGYLSGLVCLSQAWEGRDPQWGSAEHPAEGLSMAEWLRLKESERLQAVEEYAQSRPPLRFASTEERKRQMRAAL